VSNISNSVSNLIVKHRNGRTGHRLSSFADGSDCPTIGPDGECCRSIGQALTHNIYVGVGTTSE